VAVRVFVFLLWEIPRPKLEWAFYGLPVRVFKIRNFSALLLLLILRVTI